MTTGMESAQNESQSTTNSHTQQDGPATVPVTPLTTATVSTETTAEQLTEQQQQQQQRSQPEQEAASNESPAAGAGTGTPSNDNDGLEALSELVPDLKSRKNSLEHTNGMTVAETGNAAVPSHPQPGNSQHMATIGEAPGASQIPPKMKSFVSDDDVSSSEDDGTSKDVNEILYGTKEEYTPAPDANSDQALDDDSHHSTPRPPNEMSGEIGFSNGDYNKITSNQSLTTATQTHEVRTPMYLPNFKPATGCTNASDFIVRCFAARLRSGITVVKHGRSRWCKSRLRILHIHPDGKSLSWKPAQGEPTSSKRPPKLDLTTCLEVRHAWSADPQNPMYTGTPVLRQKCEAANAHKSFALIFPKRTVDITSVTADQCKVLMEGFSALCFRLQVANFAARGGKEEDGKSEAAERETASVTLTNNSMPQLSPNNPVRARR